MNERLYKAIDGINDELIEEAAAFKRRPYSKPLYLALGAAAAVALISFAVLNIPREPVLPLDGDLAQTTTRTGEIKSGGEGFGDFNPAPVTTSGEPFTAQEIMDYITVHAFEIAQMIRFDTPGVNSFRICTKGWCHVAALTDRNEMKLDFIELPILSGDRIVANVTLFRYEGEIVSSTGAGGVGWDYLNRPFIDYPDSDIAFVYYGFNGEAAITPDGHIYRMFDNIVGENNTGFDIYGVYAAGYNTFNLSEVLENKDYIEVTF